jgi:hypothetical protein
VSRHEDIVARWALIARAQAIAERARWEAVRAGTVAAREDYEFALQWLELVRRTAGRVAPAQSDAGGTAPRSPRAD